MLVCSRLIYLPAKHLSRFLLTLLLAIPGFVNAQAVSVTTITESFDGAGDLAVNSLGDIFVADFFSSTITRVTPEGDTSNFVNIGINGASGNEFDENDNLYQSDFNGNRVHLIDTNGVLSTFATVANGISGPVGVTHGQNLVDDENLRF